MRFVLLAALAGMPAAPAAHRADVVGLDLAGKRESTALSGSDFGPTCPDEGAQDGAFFVDASLDTDGKLLSWEIVRGLPGGTVDLVLAVKKRGVRELRVHAVREKKIEPVARAIVPMLEDIIAWAAADVREEAGKELVLITRSGAWSYSLTKDGYRGNATAFVRADLVYDMPDPLALPRWRYILPGAGAGGRDGVLLPERDAFALWVPDASEPGRYAPRARFPRGRAGRVRSGTRAPDDSSQSREISVGISADAAPLFFEGDRTTALLSESHSYRAPALADVDGDGRLDLVEYKAEGLSVHLDVRQAPTRVEEIPEYLKSDELELSIALHDLDGDGDVDVVAKLVEEIDGLKNAETRVVLLINDGKRLFPAEPDLILRFEAAELRTEITDVDGDGRPDLVVREFKIPSATGVVTGLEFTMTHLVYFGTKSGFDRRPAIRSEEKYDENAVAGAIANYELALDCDGDGVADLAAVDLSGKVTVRRIKKESRFLRAARWELEAAPWRSFETPGSISSLSVLDVNGDGVGDLLSAGEDRLTIFLSERKGAKR